MRADISRETFDERKQRVGVLLQQGRQLSDADWNEQVLLTLQRDREVARDTVGRAAAPRDGGGFAVGVTVGGVDLTLSTGRIYVDGLCVHNDPETTSATTTSATSLAVDAPELDGRPLVAGDPVVLPGPDGTRYGVVAAATPLSVTLQAPHGLATGVDVTLARRTLLSSQRYARGPTTSATVDGGPMTAGRYAVVLHTHLHGTSVLDDPQMAESALGGPDTSARLGVVWRVALARVGAVGTGGCDAWTPPANTARLRPSLSTPTAGVGDCALPADAGYRGLRNSLYRVEVAEVHSDGSVKRLLWDHDNGSVAIPVASIDGSTVHLESFGPRGASAFGAGQVVTVEDETTGWSSGSAMVHTIGSPDAGRMELRLDSAPGPVAPRPRLRRWGGVVENTSPGSPIEIDQGLFVSVTGSAPVGAYWLIPARSALTGSGRIEWTVGAGAPYAALPPHGPVEGWTTLAMVDFDGSTFTVVPDQVCRTEFPALSTITADDVSYDNTTVDHGAPTVQEALEALSGRAGTCTVVLKPTEDWAALLRSVPSGAHARLCFTAGDFTTSSRVVVEGKGHVVVEGMGPGTLVRATEDEVALMFVGCASVTVRDIAVAAGRSRRPRGGDGLGGALTVVGSSVVCVERVHASCSGASLPLAGCISLAGTGEGALTLPSAPGAFPSRAVVRDCSLAPGEYQVGLSIRDMRHVDVSGVVVAAPAAGAQRLADMSQVLRRRLRGALVAHVTSSITPGATGLPLTTFYSGSIREIPVPGLDLLMQVPAPLAQAWQETFRRFPRVGERSPRSHVLDIADEALLVQPTERASRLRAQLDRSLLGRTVPSWQGIVLAGQHLGQVTVRDCRVSGAIQGIHVATSRAEGTRGPFLQVDRLQVTGNTVDVVVPPEGAGERHGIFVGNVAAALVSDNIVTLSNQALRDVISSRGVALAGYLGASVVVRDNVTSRFPTGISLRAFGDAKLSEAVRWLIRGNVYWPASSPKNVPIETAYTRTQARAVLVDNV